METPIFQNYEPVKSEEESGTFNLTGGKLNYNPYKKFSNVPQYNIDSRNDQIKFSSGPIQDLQHQMGNINLKKSIGSDHYDQFIKKNDFYNEFYLNEKDPFSLSQSSKQLQSSDNYNFIGNGLKKYAQIDHFQFDNDPFQLKEILDKPNVQVEKQEPEKKDKDVQINQYTSPIKEITDNLQPIVTQALNNIGQEFLQKQIQSPEKKSEFDEDFLKKIRQEYTQEYEKKLKMAFEEIEQLKKDLIMKNELHETQQVRDLRRELKRLENILLDTQNQYIDSEKQVGILKQIINEKDQAIQKMLSGVQQKTEEKNIINDLLKEKDLHIEALILKIEELKKNLDDLSIRNIDFQNLLDQMNSSDFAKQNLILKRQNLELIEELNVKHIYGEELKQNIKLAMMKNSSDPSIGRDGSQQAVVFQQLLENLSQENMKNKRVIEELNKRENQCQRKWNKLLQENLDLQEKLNLVNIQLQRQREQYQQIIYQNERKVLEANQRLAWVQNQDDKRQAAEYLVDQMRISNEEKQIILLECQNFQSQLSELQFEYAKMENELKDFQCFRQSQGFNQDQNSQFDPIIQNTQRLIQRIEELEDLVVELKSKQQASDVVELKSLVSQLQIETQNLIQKISLLSEKRVESKELFHQNEMHQSYLQIMKEREKIIEKLQSQLKKLSENQLLKTNHEQSFGQKQNQNGMFNQYSHSSRMSSQAFDVVVNDIQSNRVEANNVNTSSIAELIKQNQKKQEQLRIQAQQDFREKKLKDTISYNNYD